MGCSDPQLCLLWLESMLHGTSMRLLALVLLRRPLKAAKGTSLPAGVLAGPRSLCLLKATRSPLTGV